MPSKKRRSQQRAAAKAAAEPRVAAGAGPAAELRGFAGEAVAGGGGPLEPTWSQAVARAVEAVRAAGRTSVLCVCCSATVQCDAPRVSYRKARAALIAEASLRCREGRAVPTSGQINKQARDWVACDVARDVGGVVRHSISGQTHRTSPSKVEMMLATSFVTCGACAAEPDTIAAKKLEVTEFYAHQTGCACRDLVL